MASKSKSIFSILRKYVKAPWEFTGPQSHPEYKNAVPMVHECRVFCPASSPENAIVPTASPDTVYAIDYYPRDQRRNRPPIKRTIIKKGDAMKMVKEAKFDVNQFPPPYLTKMVEEDYSHVGGGYQK